MKTRKCGNEMNHTPTPLRITKDGGIEDDRGVLMFMAVAPSSKQLGPQIVRAVNCHEELLNQLRRALGELETHQVRVPFAIADIRQSIAEAEGK